MDYQAVKEDRQGKVPYEFIRDIFKDKDPFMMSELAGAPYDPEGQRFTVHMMGRVYHVQYPTGEIYTEEGEPMEVYAVMTLFLRYLANARGIPTTGKDITYKEIPGGHVYYSNFNNRTIARLARIFGNNLEELKKAFEIIGGQPVKMGDAGYRFQFMNNVYLTFILWKGDEELAAAANILFDMSTPYYFDAEDLAVVGDVAIGVLRNHGTIPNWKGLYENKHKKEELI